MKQKYILFRKYFKKRILFNKTDINMHTHHHITTIKYILAFNSPFKEVV